MTLAVLSVGVAVTTLGVAVGAVAVGVVTVGVVAVDGVSVLIAVLAGGLAGAVVCASTGAVSMLVATSAAANFLNMGYSFSRFAAPKW